MVWTCIMGTFLICTLLLICVYFWKIVCLVPDSIPVRRTSSDQWEDLHQHCEKTAWILWGVNTQGDDYVWKPPKNPYIIQKEWVANLQQSVIICMLVLMAAVRPLWGPLQLRLPGGLSLSHARAHKCTCTHRTRNGVLLVCLTPLTTFPVIDLNIGLCLTSQPVNVRIRLSATGNCQLSLLWSSEMCDACVREYICAFNTQAKVWIIAELLLWKAQLFAP